MDSQEVLNTENTGQESKIKIELFEWVEAVIMAFVTVLLILTFAFRTAGVDGHSMNPTLHHGDRVIIAEAFQKYYYGDIVAITKPNSENKVLIKRIIATEGQTVDIDIINGAISVDGNILDEPYIEEITKTLYDVEFPVTVPDGCVFVMGDNRNHSKDSRFEEVGMIDTRYLMGKCVFRVLPFSTFGKIH